MLNIAHATLDFQRLAAGRHCTWRAAAALALARFCAPALLALLAAGGAGMPAVLLGLLAGVLGLLVSKARVARMAWILLRPHLARLARRAAQAHASARVRALACAINNAFCIFLRRLELIHAAAIVIIGNRLLPTACISPRIKSQRPN